MALTNQDSSLAVISIDQARHYRLTAWKAGLIVNSSIYVRSWQVQGASKTPQTSYIPGLRRFFR